MKILDQSRLPLLRSLFGYQNCNGTLLYHSSSISGHSLYRRISPLGDPKVSVVPILDDWVQQGNPVTQTELQLIIKELILYKRFNHALQISQWMSDKRHMRLSPKDVAARLNLISRVHGLDEVENYFNNIPRKLKRFEVYTSLLNCYARQKSQEKAEAVMQQLRDKWNLKTPVCYNILMNLYYQTEQHEKVDSLISEMEEKGIPFDQYTFSIRLGSYAATSDIEGINKIIEKAESYHGLVLEWSFYSTAAQVYLKVGIEDKALEMLKKLEKLLPTARSKNLVFDALLRFYAQTGKSDELYRVWNLYKKQKLYNKGYISMISSLLKINDIEGAEKIFEEWESTSLSFDFRIPGLLIDTYCRKGFLGKAEVLVDKAKAKGGELPADLWYRLASGYLENNQIPKAVEARKKAISVCPPGWKPSKETLIACLMYLEGKEELEEAEN